MATTAVTRPAVIPQPDQILRQGLLLAAVVVIGVALGMLIDSGRAGLFHASGLTTGQQAAADRLAAQAAALDNARSLNATSELLRGQAGSVAAGELPSPALVDPSSVFYDPLTSRATFGGVPIEGHYSPELSTWIFGPAAAVVEHGAFTPMAFRDPAVIEERFVGGDATLDPDALPIAGLGEHGAFTSMAFRDPAVIEERFVGGDANLDPEVAAAPTAVYDPGTSSLVPARGESTGIYDPETSRWIE